MTPQCQYVEQCIVTVSITSALQAEIQQSLSFLLMDLLTLQVCSDIKMSLKWKLQWIMQKLLCLHYSTMQDEVSALPRPQFKRENKQLSGFFDILIHVAFGVISSCLKFQPNAQKPASTHSDFSFVPITWWVVRHVTVIRIHTNIDFHFILNHKYYLPNFIN